MNDLEKLVNMAEGTAYKLYPYWKMNILTSYPKNSREINLGGRERANE